MPALDSAAVGTVDCFLGLVLPRWSPPAATAAPALVSRWPGRRVPGHFVLPALPARAVEYDSWERRFEAAPTLAALVRVPARHHPPPRRALVLSEQSLPPLEAVAAMADPSSNRLLELRMVLQAPCLRQELKAVAYPSRRISAVLLLSRLRLHEAADQELVYVQSRVRPSACRMQSGPYADSN